MHDNICAEVAETNQKGEVLTENYTILPILRAHTIALSLRYASASNYWNCEIVYGQRVRKFIFDYVMCRICRCLLREHSYIYAASAEDNCTDSYWPRLEKLS